MKGYGQKRQRDEDGGRVGENSILAVTRLLNATTSLERLNVVKSQWTNRARFDIRNHAISTKESEIILVGMGGGGVVCLLAV